MIANSKFFNLA